MLNLKMLNAQNVVVKQQYENKNKHITVLKVNLFLFMNLGKKIL